MVVSEVVDRVALSVEDQMAASVVEVGALVEAVAERAGDLDRRH